MGRAPCCDKANVKKGPWSPEEDAKLKDFIDKHGTGGNWIALPHKAGLKRCGKSCRLRWLNYLRPNIKHGEFSEDEDRIICSLYANIGSRWSIIAGQLPGRTDNDIKNYWNTKLRKKLLVMLPSFQKKQPSLFPSIELQKPLISSSPTPPFSSSFYNYYNPNPNPNNFMINVNNHINTTATATDLFSPPPSNPNLSNPNLMAMISNNNNHNYLGFQSDYHHQTINNSYYYPEVKEKMLMFGGVSEIKDHDDDNGMMMMIKQEEQFKGFGEDGDEMHSLIRSECISRYRYVDDEKLPKGYLRNYPVHNELIEEGKQMNNNNSVNINGSYLLQMNDDENKTTHNIISDGCCNNLI